MKENFIICINAVLPLFFMMLAGFIARRAGLIREEDITRINKIAFTVFLPCMLFKNIYGADLSKVANIRMLLMAGLGILGMFVFGWIGINLIVRDRSKHTAMIHCMGRTNFALLGIPIAVNLLGEGGDVSPMAFLITVTSPVFNILVVVLFELYRGGKVKAKDLLLEIVRNPLIIGATAGLLCVLLNIRIPTAVESTIRQFGNVATPLLVFVIGAFLKFDTFCKQLRNIVIATVGRLFVIPAIALGICYALGFTGIEMISAIGLFAAASGIVCFTMTAQMGGDAELAGDIVVMTNALVPFTMFLWLMLFKTLGVI